MTGEHIAAVLPMACRHHIALHLAHRWFAFLEAPGGDLEAHLKIFHPQVRLSGHGGTRLFAHDHESLIAWLAAIPDEISSHHIIHSTYTAADDGDIMNMIVAYQSPGRMAMHGSIISYKTLVEFTPEGARFVMLDKTPILNNTRQEYETSWSSNRALARVHAELGRIAGSDGQLSAVLGQDLLQVSVRATAPEGASAYEAVVTSIRDADRMRVVRLELSDDGRAIMPTIERIAPLSLHSAKRPDLATGPGL